MTRLINVCDIVLRNALRSCYFCTFITSKYDEVSPDSIPTFALITLCVYKKTTKNEALMPVFIYTQWQLNEFLNKRSVGPAEGRALRSE